MALHLRIAVVLFVAEGLRTQDQSRGSSHAGMGGTVNIVYTFEDFVRDNGRQYDAGSEEYARRAAIFQDSLSQIHAKNSRANRSWTAGVYPFMDWTGAERAERLHGYRPSSFRRMAVGTSSVVLQTGRRNAANEQSYGSQSDSFEATAPPVRNQGACGSCWAIAAVEAVEAQLLRLDPSWSQQAGDGQLSPQALLDCVRNPKHCGGDGGCGGATPQLAFEYMQSNGLPLEADMPYSPADTGSCPIEPFPVGKMRVSLAGWRDLPTNQAGPLMQALVEEGPAVVAVHAHHWDNYRSGVFDGCVKDAIPSHSVLLRGYGVSDQSSGMEVSLRKYWVIQNSWGVGWGEEGSIRLLRRDDDDSWCGTDSQPQKGAACDDDAHTEITVCGSCGLLYDATIPQIGHVGITKAGDAADARKSKARLSRLNDATMRFRARAQEMPPQVDAQDASVSDVATLGWHSHVEALTTADPDVRVADALETSSADTSNQDKVTNGQPPADDESWWLPLSNVGSVEVQAPHVREEAPLSHAKKFQLSTPPKHTDTVRSAFSEAEATFAKWKVFKGSKKN